MHLSGDAAGELPAVDEHIVAEGCGYEIFGGILVRIPPSPEPHVRRRSKLAMLLETHVADEFNAALWMLTRTSETTDIAPDACVYSRARDPRTGGRQLEHLAFLIVDAGSIEYAGRKAASLVGRGVHRVLAIDIERDCVLEWSRGRGVWDALESEASIAEPSLAAPLPVEALICEDLVEAAAWRALMSSTQGRAQRIAAGMARGVVDVLATRGLRLSAQEQEQILSERDFGRLQRWADCIGTCASGAELLAIH